MRFVFTLLILCSSIFAQGTVKYIDPFIGTAGHAHTFPGATLPFGMVQLSPDTDNKGWDWCSGYHYSDNSIMGFSHTHLSGTGATDYGDILLMPYTGSIKLIPGSKANPDEGYRSRFSHKDEKASAGFYSVKLADYDIDVELTATERTGIHKYVFNNSRTKRIIIDLEHGISDKVIESKIGILGRNIIYGYRKSKGWASNHTIYFYALLSESFDDAQVFEELKPVKKQNYKGKKVKTVLSFSGNSNKEIFVKVGISHTSIEGAKLNLMKENSDWNFEKIKQRAEKKWQNELDKISISTNDEELKKVFYTAYYHSLIAPNVFSDVNNFYVGMDGKKHQSEKEQYTVFSLWDTYRALHPLLTITDKKRTESFVNSLLTKYEEYGLLPVWELAANETNCMIGYHAVPVILDSYAKGINVDLNNALDAVLASGNQNIRSTDIYRKYGIIPSEIDHEGVSKTLEYAYDDWCIAQLAKAADREEIYDEYIARSKNYINYFDPETKFMRPKRNGKWVEKFNPFAVTSDFTEANSWQYTFSVQQDIPGLMNLFGGKENFDAKLDELFSAKSKLSGRHQPDITGLIGQYAHGNEPSHHVAYLYNYAGKPWKTQERVREICDSLYFTGPEGLSGNDDCGQLSAWYVFSSMGFYPVTPGSDLYIIGSPMFDKVEIKLEEGKTFTVKTINNSKENKYVQSLTLNGEEYNKPYISHSDITNGSEFVFVMGAKPNTNWGLETEKLFRTEEVKKLPQPVLTSGDILFVDQTKISIDPINKDAVVYYTTDGSEPMQSSIKYSEPFVINKNTLLKFKSFAEGYNASSLNEVKFNKNKTDWNIEILSKWHQSYPGGGINTLIDGIRGGQNYRTGYWQGYEGQNFEAVIDLKKETEISKLGAGFFQDYGIWIFMPKKVTFFISENGENFTEIISIKNEISFDKPGTIVQDLVGEIKPTKTRYVKIVVEALKTCPDWHGGAGLNSFIFIDEIIIE
ncbi:MAG: GH92 family glycosyl hydrolase [Rhodothermaceae bacterium]